ncbi:hypothetical protein RBH26_19840 [Natronolimnohabitans sp. A-GB9]|uniref:hypothetical protein n=1 Tax=Natronolimnohabitans sp. A-GB9 TaxID=3069757 RepID=UPI0027B4D879|nr:hypothetical protein [Natronolimnohabitans sp. A-GB9]MDQ2052703.1 hypothetical protein [Natronolimnohabitans sp. A-GB9]
MSNDDSRDSKTPDRRNESPTTIAARLEAIDTLTRTLLEDVHDPQGTALEDTSRDTKTTVREHVLEIRAQASLLGIRVLGPEAAIPYRPADDPDEGGSPPGYRPAATTYSGPTPEALERERERQRRRMDDGATMDDGAMDEPATESADDGDETPDDDADASDDENTATTDEEREATTDDEAQPTDEEGEDDD